MKNVNEVLLSILLLITIISLTKSIKFENNKFLFIKEFLQDYRNFTVTARKEPSLSTEVTINFIYYEGKNKSIVISNYNPKIPIIAKGLYIKSRFDIGWDRLFIKTKNSSNSIIQCYFAGYLEGVLTHESIDHHYHNMKRLFLKKPKQLQELKEIYKKVNERLNSKIKVEYFLSLDKEDLEKWIYYACIKAQLDGLESGYNSISKKNLQIEDFYILNSVGNIDELKMYLDVKEFKFENNDFKFSSKKNYKKIFKSNDIKSVWKDYVTKNSAIFRLNKNETHTDLIIGQTAFADYSLLFRILKVYEFTFDVTSKIFPMNFTKVYFTSYPGALYSGDDFYLNSNDLCICHSKITPLNYLIYKQALDVKDYIPDFMRIMTATYKANSTEEWYKLYKTYSSRLYSTQWLIADYKMIRNGNEKMSNLLMLVEDIPGSILSFDLTDKLIENRGFNSINIPYFKQIQDVVGISFYKEYGLNLMADDYNPRNIILKQLNKNVYKIDEISYMLSYNGFGFIKKALTIDPSHDNPSLGVSQRYDLMKVPEFKGAIDQKIIDVQTMKLKKMMVKCGPTSKFNKHIEPFNFNEFSNNTNIKNYHKGLPSEYDFETIYFKDDFHD